MGYAPAGAASGVRMGMGLPRRAAEEIGCTAEVPLREGLERLIAWRAAHKGEVEARRATAA